MKLVFVLSLLLSSYTFGSDAVYTYDEENRLKTAVIGGKQINYEYDEAGNIVEVTTPYASTISISGVPVAEIKSNGESSICKTSCGFVYVQNSPIQLNAVETTASRFDGWSGACSGTGACNLIANTLHEVTATFTNLCPNDLNADSDGDGVCGDVDNCPFLPNADQSNIDGDLDGDACDSDIDGDGTQNDTDLFPNDAGEFVDTDSDGEGNVRDTDDDGDGVSDSEELTRGTNPLLADTDGDGASDSIDAFPLDPTRIIPVALTTLDVNGDGSINGFTDGVIITRFMLGYPVQDIATDQEMVGATKTRQQIFDLLNSLIEEQR